MIREIITAPNDILTTKAESVLNPQEYKDFIVDLIDTFRANPAVGLAAPQIGLSRRIMVIGETAPMVILNPGVIKHSDRKETMPEGCLSLPGVMVEVPRYLWITLGGMDEYRNLITLSLSGLMARVAQHELDHINGILIDSYSKERIP